MEAVPRIPMMAFELKMCSDRVDFTSTLLSYIQNFYNEDPTTYRNECAELDQLRQSAVEVSKDYMGCSILKKYYSQLLLLEKRFPLAEGGAAALITFSWIDAFSNKVISYADIKYEEACILFNLGALHSILGTIETRHNPEGMKVACTHFQCAAWAFQHLRENFSATYSADMSSDLLAFKIDLMLAQAQECILEKSMMDNRKSSITAKIAAQIAEYYQSAIRTLDVPNVSNALGSRRCKDWKKRLVIKQTYYQAVMYYYLGWQAEELQKWGERVAYCQGALDKLNDVIKLAKNEEDFEETLKFVLDVFTGKFNAVKKDNDFIYHEKVPTLESLPEVKGASLVKGVAFNPNDPEISGPDIFRRLISMETHAASSLYSEEKAKILRRIVEEIAKKNNELIQFESSFLVDRQQLFLEQELLPAELIAKCAAFSVKPTAITDLKQAMNALARNACDVETNIREIRDMLNNNDALEKEFQEKFGKRKRNVMLDSVEEDCLKNENAVKSAMQMSEDLRQQLEKHIENLQKLTISPTELTQMLPTVATIADPQDDAVIHEMKRLLDKVDEMKEQRKQKEQELRQQLLADDITGALVIYKGVSQDEFFTEQLKKHDPLLEVIEKNLAAQSNILRALTEANAKYASIRKKVLEVKTRRNETINNLMESYDVYEDLLTKTQKGATFYENVNANVNQLFDKAQRITVAEEEERQMIINRYKPKEPPPQRPVAPKPGQTVPMSTGLIANLSAMPPNFSADIPSVTSGYPGIPSSLLPIAPEMYANLNDAMPTDYISMLQSVHTSSEPPKLKDYLPFMKSQRNRRSSPASAGNPSAVNPQIPLNTGSLPPSIHTSPIHFGSQILSLPGSPLPDDFSRNVSKQGVGPFGVGQASAYAPTAQQPAVPSKSSYPPAAVTPHPPTNHQQQFPPNLPHDSFQRPQQNALGQQQASQYSQQNTQQFQPIHSSFYPQRPVGQFELKQDQLSAGGQPETSSPLQMPDRRFVQNPQKYSVQNDNLAHQSSQNQTLQNQQPAQPSLTQNQHLPTNQRLPTSQPFVQPHQQFQQNIDPQQVQKSQQSFQLNQYQPDFLMQSARVVPGQSNNPQPSLQANQPTTGNNDIGIHSAQSTNRPSDMCQVSGQFAENEISSLQQPVFRQQSGRSEPAPQSSQVDLTHHQQQFGQLSQSSISSQLNTASSNQSFISSSSNQSQLSHIRSQQVSHTEIVMPPGQQEQLNSSSMSFLQSKQMGQLSSASTPSEILEYSSSFYSGPTQFGQAQSVQLDQDWSLQATPNTLQPRQPLHQPNDQLPEQMRTNQMQPSTIPPNSTQQSSTPAMSSVAPNLQNVQPALLQSSQTSQPTLEHAYPDHLQHDLMQSYQQQLQHQQEISSPGISQTPPLQSHSLVSSFSVQSSRVTTNGMQDPYKQEQPVQPPAIPANVSQIMPGQLPIQPVLQTGLQPIEQMGPSKQGGPASVLPSNQMLNNAYGLNSNPLSSQALLPNQLRPDETSIKLTHLPDYTLTSGQFRSHVDDQAQQSKQSHMFNQSLTSNQSQVENSLNVKPQLSTPQHQNVQSQVSEISQTHRQQPGMNQLSGQQQLPDQPLNQHQLSGHQMSGQRQLLNQQQFFGHQQQLTAQLPPGQHQPMAYQQPLGQYQPHMQQQPLGQNQPPSLQHPLGQNQPPTQQHPLDQNQPSTQQQPSGQYQPSSLQQPAGQYQPSAQQHPLGQNQPPTQPQPSGQYQPPSQQQPAGQYQPSTQQQPSGHYQPHTQRQPSLNQHQSYSQQQPSGQLMAQQQLGQHQLTAQQPLNQHQQLLQPSVQQPYGQLPFGQHLASAQQQHVSQHQAVTQQVPPGQSRMPGMPQISPQQQLPYQSQPHAVSQSVGLPQSFGMLQPNVMSQSDVEAQQRFPQVSNMLAKNQLLNSNQPSMSVQKSTASQPPVYSNLSTNQSQAPVQSHFPNQIHSIGQSINISQPQSVNQTQLPNPSYLSSRVQLPNQPMNPSLPLQPQLPNQIYSVGQPQLVSQPQLPIPTCTPYQIQQPGHITNTSVVTLMQSSGQPQTQNPYLQQASPLHAKLDPMPVSGLPSQQPQSSYPSQLPVTSHGGQFVAGQSGPLVVSQNGQYGTVQSSQFQSAIQPSVQTHFQQQPIVNQIHSQAQQLGFSNLTQNANTPPSQVPTSSAIYGQQPVALGSFHMQSAQSVLQDSLESLPPPLMPVSASNKPDVTASLQSLRETDNSVTSSPLHEKRQTLGSSTNSSLDDILATSPATVSNINNNSRPDSGILTPKVLTADDVLRLKEEEEVKKKKVRDPYDNAEKLSRFTEEVEKFAKNVEMLIRPILSGSTQLDKDWKELNDEQERLIKKLGLSMGIARCYPLKNRFPDVMPYDSTRVILTGGKDDYINASMIGDLAPSSPKWIVTQSPMTATIIDFWQMIYEQGVEVIVMLNVENEAAKKYPVYWAEDKGGPVSHGPFTIHLQSSKTRNCWIERILTLAHKETHQSRSVVHLQFISWPPSGIPETPALLLQFVNEVQSFYIQQRSLFKPVVVHCSDGTGRCGAYCVVHVGVQEINQGHDLINILEIVSELRKRRKNMVSDHQLLLYTYHVLLYHAQDILMKRGVLTNRATFGSKLPSHHDKEHHRKPSDDFILGSGVSFSVIQSSVAKLGSSSTSVVLGQHNFDSIENASNALQQNMQSLSMSQSTLSSHQTDDSDAFSLPDDHQSCASLGADSESNLNNNNSNIALLEQQSNNMKTNLQIPPSLANLQNPQTFEMDCGDSPNKKRISKASFMRKEGGGLLEATNKPDDPLSNLDPLWTLKAGSGAGGGNKKL